jgi:hypothetical protein
VITATARAIRYEGGSLTLNSVYFTTIGGIARSDDPNGSITTNNSSSFNGFGDSHTHNLAVGNIAIRTITGSYFYDANVGTKSRAEPRTR